MMALCYLFPRFAKLWLLLAILVATSRVTLTAHFLSDVIAGLYLGSITTVLLAKYVFDKYPRLMFE